MQYTITRQAVHLQHFFSALMRRAFWVDVIEIAANHHGDKLADLNRFIIYGGDVLSVAHDGRAIGDQRQLFQTVRDVDNPRALSLEHPRDVKQTLDFTFGQRGGGFIHD